MNRLILNKKFKTYLLITVPMGVIFSLNHRMDHPMPVHSEELYALGGACIGPFMPLILPVWIPYSMYNEYQFQKQNDKKYRK